jgi:hypothetical protein
MVVAGIAAGIFALPGWNRRDDDVPRRLRPRRQPAGDRTFFDVVNDANSVKIAFLARALVERDRRMAQRAGAR